MQSLNILQIDASARPGISGVDPRGSHTRRLTRRFVERWQAARPQDSVTYRDVGQQPPSPVSSDWIAAAFTRPERRDEAARAQLAESDMLVQELLRADLIVIGAPMYNFGLPAQLKAWVDNVVRVGVTFGFDRSRQGEPYWPMLPAGKRLFILSSRGDYGYDPGGRLGDINLVERGLSVPMSYLGLTQTHSIAIEYDEFGDERLRASISAAEAAVDALVAELARNAAEVVEREPVMA
ncbi:FMN-dependent NADH-azoreductase [Bosea sp. CRIB-10]|uniref:FMN-dependent NADH-azoreductase n=1 Tax=Bosea sp. CRIB-10 TaxID=378404 RepID=UPI0008E970F1|nr:NAD(P)H-dependent oxidoreductase [Bosea sp. CRIB-10]SFC90281.1 FMN-dependent NADH-azoreductase [Bosea sp. CRIB-10]